MGRRQTGSTRFSGGTARHRHRRCLDDSGRNIVENSRILIACAAVILILAVALSLMSPKRHSPDPAACEVLRPQRDWDDPAYRLLCADSGDGRR